MITKEAVEAARSAIRYLNGPDTPWSDEQVSAVLTAALAAMPEQGGRQNYNCPCAHPSQCDSSCLTPAPSLAAENERLRAALAFYSCQADNCDCVPGKEEAESVWCGFRARKALEGRT